MGRTVGAWGCRRVLGFRSDPAGRGASSLTPATPAATAAGDGGAADASARECALRMASIAATASGVGVAGMASSGRAAATVRVASGGAEVDRRELCGGSG